MFTRTALVTALLLSALPAARAQEVITMPLLREGLKRTIQEAGQHCPAVKRVFDANPRGRQIVLDVFCGPYFGQEVYVDVSYRVRMLPGPVYVLVPPRPRLLVERRITVIR